MDEDEPSAGGAAPDDEGAIAGPSSISAMRAARAGGGARGAPTKAPPAIKKGQAEAAGAEPLGAAARAAAAASLKARVGGAFEGGEGGEGRAGEGGEGSSSGTGSGGAGAGGGRAKRPDPIEQQQMELLRTLLQDKRQDQGMDGAAVGAATGAATGAVTGDSASAHDSAPLRTAETRAVEARQERVRARPLIAPLMRMIAC